MPITLTVTGHEEIITSLQNLSDKIQGPEVVQELVLMSSEVLASEAPVGRRGSAGLLQRTISEVAGPEPTGEGWWAGVGNLEGIYPLEPAPKGTIAAFLEIMRERRGEIGKRKRKRATGTGFVAQRAWWYLSEKEKQELRAMREAGETRVGGASPYRPFYWWIQEKGYPGVVPKAQRYIETAVNTIKGQIQQVIERVLASV